MTERANPKAARSTQAGESTVAGSVPRSAVNRLFRECFNERGAHKRKHATEAAAWKHIHDLERKGKVRVGVYEAYPAPCGFFHIGRTRGTRKRGGRRRRGGRR
jgi:hypothetical protein